MPHDALRHIEALPAGQRARQGAPYPPCRGRNVSSKPPRARNVSARIANAAPETAATTSGPERLCRGSPRPRQSVKPVRCTALPQVLIRAPSERSTFAVVMPISDSGRSGARSGSIQRSSTTVSGFTKTRNSPDASRAARLFRLTPQWTRSISDLRTRRDASGLRPRKRVQERPPSGGACTRTSASNLPRR